VWVIARRGLIHMKRQPEQPERRDDPADHVRGHVRYVFGGAMRCPALGRDRAALREF